MKLAFAIVIRSDGRLEIPRIGKAVSADRTELRQSEWKAVVFADVSASLLVLKHNAKLHAPRNQAYLPGRNIEDAKLRVNTQRPKLRNNQQLAVSGVKKTVLHRRIGGIDMDRHANLHCRIAVATYRHDAVDEVRLLLWNRQWIPAKLIWR